jgi:hypothetical protein
VTELVRVKNRSHGGIAALPESALQHLEDWEPVPGPPPATPKPRRDLRRLEAAANAATPAEPEPEPTPKPTSRRHTSEKE